MGTSRTWTVTTTRSRASIAFLAAFLLLVLTLVAAPGIASADREGSGHHAAPASARLSDKAEARRHAQYHARRAAARRAAARRLARLKMKTFRAPVMTIGIESRRRSSWNVSSDKTLPTVPSGVTADPGNTQVALRWTASTDPVGVASYRVYRNGSLVTSPTTTAYTDTGRVNGTTYSYAVAAVDKAGNVSAKSATVSATPVAPAAPAAPADTSVPSTPAGLKATAGDAQVALTWSAASDNVAVSGYRVYRNGSLVASPAGTSMTDTGRVNGTAYSYTVAAVDAAGNASAQSAAVSATPVAPADTSAPSAPAGLKATAGDAQVALTWSAASDNVAVSGYRVYRNGSLVASPAGTSMTDTGRVNGTAYSYTVAAVDAAGNASAQSAAVSATPAATPPPAPVPNQKLYWGAWIGSHITGSQAPWDMNAVTTFEQSVGKNLSLVNFSSPFYNCSTSPCTPYNFPITPFNNVRNHGAIPFFSWNSASLPVTNNEPDFQLSDVIAGRYDSYITSWATAAKNWGHPFFLRFNWEMNGAWFPWSEGSNGNKPGEYVTAWRHVHDLFTQAGATNATWTWCPNVNIDGKLQPLDTLYPGDSYVDWTCLDGYNWNTPWKSFESVFGGTYDTITNSIAPNKPMIIGETGSTETGGSKAQWITDMFKSLPTRFPKVRGLLYFDKFDDGMDWPLETSAAATTAFKNGLASGNFVSNTLGSFNTSPIPTP